MTTADYDEVLTLWQRTEGVGLNESDSAESIAAFLQRNPGFSRVTRDAAGRIVGAMLCGHDGRRGYLHHLAVDAAHRRKGLGRRLVDACLGDLRQAGISRCNISVFADNVAGQEFWLRQGWGSRAELRVLQKRL